MRRTDREISSRNEIDDMLRGARVLHLSFAVDGEPYVIPISFGYDGECIYIHTAKEGRKIDCIASNPRVCFQVERNVTLVRAPDDGCAWSFAFESVIGYGVVEELTDPEERIAGLNHIMQHYSGKDWEFGDAALASTRVWRIVVESVTGKRSVEKAAD